MNDLNPVSDGDESRRNRKPRPIQRIDVNPPYGPAPAEAVEEFRKLLAELIARQITAERNTPGPPNDPDQS